LGNEKHFIPVSGSRLVSLLGKPACLYDKGLLQKEVTDTIYSLVIEEAYNYYHNFFGDNHTHTLCTTPITLSICCWGGKEPITSSETDENGFTIPKFASSYVSKLRPSPFNYFDVSISFVTIFITVIYCMNDVWVSVFFWNINCCRCLGSKTKVEL
jgi:hypothetical protein